MFTISPKQFGNKYALPTIRDSGACFGLNKITASKPVIIVESETDCLLLKTYGFNNVIATTSASFSKTQIYNIPSPNLWVGFDNDDAGRRATKKLIEVSNGKLVHVINWENAGGKDPGDAENRLDIVRAFNKKILVDKKARHGKYF
jgi:DNA primase